MFFAVAHEALADLLEIVHVDTDGARDAVCEEVVDYAVDLLGWIQLITLRKLLFIGLNPVNQLLDDLVIYKHLRRQVIIVDHGWVQVR